MAGKGTNVEVTLEDQQNINTFGKLNNRRHDLESEIAGSKKLLDDLEDAGNELMLSDEQEALFVVGECFLHLSNDEAEERIQKHNEEVEERRAKFEAELEHVNERMAELKTLLYGKFGNSINLEE
mmetsp:Transcript_28759/g.80981  ORF Transcript_28759/g.80981 Transcript_28759/m.80981 type:complete len:125 (-) Transcript_28759:233-607(-)|eukprot:CAMPEP_0117681372 /NCGR_PEP_ID=MMETSP0804-20121206/18944_1 /TAXON_ID=1074897 /ORGANISM="Tetraselmis astigmatica, Strain CCMP880" /LENGTH=124 /DNA_ID=CAMNT_0005491119 /DNA_START=170 /DNA_END=544 /DNA_ORIENTATION=-